MRIAKTLAVALFLCISTAALMAQSTISGTVSDSNNGVTLPGANVILRNSADGSFRGTATDPDGRYTIKNIADGEYEFVVSYQGFQEFKETISFSGTQQITKDVVLQEGILLNPVIISASKRKEKVTDAPAAIEVVSAQAVKNISTASAVDLVKSAKSVDVAQQGIAAQTVVTRGFNNIFSGSLLILTDNRIARVPSLRANAVHMLSTSNDDIEQIEMVLGPGSALYGPNVNSGVMHFITKSPLNEQSTSFSLSGGQQNFMKAQFRTSFKLSDKLGIKVSGQYLNADDFELDEVAWTDATIGQQINDPNFIAQTDPYRLDELRNRAAWLANPNRDPAQSRIGLRDYSVEKYALDARLDYEINENTTFVLNGGFNSASNVELTGLGAGLADNWFIYNVQAKVTHKNMFAQVYLNGSDAGDTYIVPTGNTIIDNSTLSVAQFQHNLTYDKLRVTYGLDFLLTTPRTEGSVNGRNEANDQVSEIGLYSQATYSLSNKFDLVGSFRVDRHSIIEDPVFSPRAGIVFKPSEGHTFRLTYNRSFSTPSSNGLWLDLQAGNVPTPIPGLAYQVRAQGVPNNGFQFQRGANGRPIFYSPLAQQGGQFVPIEQDLSDATAWGIIQALAIGNGVPADLMSAIPAPSAGAVGFNMASLNTSTAQFEPTTDVTDIPALSPTIYNTIEIGYKGLIDNKLLLTTDVYYTKAFDFVGPLINETPNVFVNGGQLSEYLTPYFQGAGLLQGAQGISAATGIPFASANPNDAAAFINSLPANVAALVGAQFGGATSGAGIIQAIQAGAAAQAAQLGSGLAAAPIGLVSPNGAFDRDAIMLTYRNFGEIDYFGIDIGMEYLLTNNWRVVANYSHISDDSWLDLDGKDDFDIYLNAPRNKYMLATNYSDRKWTGEIRYRFVEGFPIESGIWVTELGPDGRRRAIDSYGLLDFNLGYDFPNMPGLRATINVTNALNVDNVQFAGTPNIGRLSLLGISYKF
jgi:iron complex outermembrane receptor protein